MQPDIVAGAVFPDYEPRKEPRKGVNQEKVSGTNAIKISRSPYPALACAGLGKVAVP
jgi:hypothetical protein